jgi:hypothetical protein
MRTFGRKFRWRSVARRLGVGLTLCAYLATLTGLPLPAASRKDTSQPYPCMDHPCGCRSAEDCWRHCCCLTIEERWAWARAHNVTPPAYAERPAGAGWRSTPLREQAGTEAGAECRSCCHQAEPAAYSCCNSSPACACCEDHPAPQQPETSPAATGPRWVLTIAALRCQGLATFWVSTGAVSLPPPAPGSLPAPAPGERITDRPATPVLLSDSPPVPPPRGAAAAIIAIASW